MAGNEIIDIDQLPITLQMPPIKVGSDYAFVIEILDDNENPQDTTGWDMEIKGRTGNPNGEELFDLTVGTEISHSPSLGKFAVKIPAATTETFKVSSIVWDCKITDGNGDITFPFEGTFTILESVTR